MLNFIALVLSTTSHLWIICLVKSTHIPRFNFTTECCVHRTRVCRALFLHSYHVLVVSHSLAQFVHSPLLMKYRTSVSRTRFLRFYTFSMLRAISFNMLVFIVAMAHCCRVANLAKVNNTNQTSTLLVASVSICVFTMVIQHSTTCTQQFMSLNREGNTKETITEERWPAMQMISTTLSSEEFNKNSH